MFIKAMNQQVNETFCFWIFLWEILILYGKIIFVKKKVHFINSIPSCKYNKLGYKHLQILS